MTPLLRQDHRCAAALVLLLTFLGTPPLQAAGHNPEPQTRSVPAVSSVSIPPTLLQRLRRALGLGRLTDVAGSRSGAGARSVCLLTPAPGRRSTAISTPAVVQLARPTVAFATPLNELRIESGEQILWQQLASSTKAIEAPVPWPIQPLVPGQQLQLRLRPRGVSGGDFATITIQAADAAAMARTRSLLEQLASDERAWLNVVEQQLQRGQPELAWQLLFSAEAPNGKAIASLRGELLAQGCRG